MGFLDCRGPLAWICSRAHRPRFWRCFSFDGYSSCERVWFASCFNCFGLRLPGSVVHKGTAACSLLKLVSTWAFQIFSCNRVRCPCFRIWQDYFGASSWMISCHSAYSEWATFLLLLHMTACTFAQCLKSFDFLTWIPQRSTFLVWDDFRLSACVACAFANTSWAFCPLWSW